MRSSTTATCFIILSKKQKKKGLMKHLQCFINPKLSYTLLLHVVQTWETYSQMALLRWL